MIEKMGAEEALQRALAFMCGQNEQLTQRSAICGMEGFVTYLFTSHDHFTEITSVFEQLSRNFSS